MMGLVPNHTCAASAGARPGPRQVAPSLTPGSWATDEGWKALGVKDHREGPRSLLWMVNACEKKKTTKAYLSIELTLCVQPLVFIDDSSYCDGENRKESERPDEIKCGVCRQWGFR